MKPKHVSLFDEFRLWWEGLPSNRRPLQTVTSAFDAGWNARDALKPELTQSSEEVDYAKLVAFFNSPEGAAMGRAGDYDQLSTADCAIRFLRRAQDGHPLPR